MFKTAAVYGNCSREDFTENYSDGKTYWLDRIFIKRRDSSIVFMCLTKVLIVVDLVMFLRPTESPIIFLQQLGRGLRKALKRVSDCTDFAGNYRRQIWHHIY